MVIYIDILFAVNMLMDMTIIWAAGMIMKERVNIPRILAGAAFGAFMYVITPVSYTHLFAPAKRSFSVF